MKIIGLTCHYTGNHDNSAALLVNGKIIFAESQERISRIKHDKHFPDQAISHALKFQKLKFSDIDYFASGSPPTSQFKLFFSYIKGFKYAGFKKVIIWFLSRFYILFKGVESPLSTRRPKDYEEMGLPKKKLIYISHHLAHAETAYYFSGMDECLVVVLDGYGVDSKGFPLSGSIFFGKEGSLEHLEDIPAYTSLGLCYGAVTVALGFKLNDGEGKTMGLASYGQETEAVGKIRELFPNFDGQKWIPKKNWLEINGVSRTEYFRLTPTYQYLRFLIEEYDAENIAFAAQKVFEQELEKYFTYLVKKYSFTFSKKKINLAVAGGIFLNVKMNMMLLKNKIVDDIFVYPNPADGGVAVGAAITAYKRQGKKFQVTKLETTTLGCEFSDKEIKEVFKKFKNKITVQNYKEKICQKAAKEISLGKVIGWFQGRGEWGPRALGQRSVLADPRKIETKERINSKLKERDWFMPFAPAILEEYADKFLVNNYATPFMTLTDNVRPSKTGLIPAAIHVDNTARSQVVKKNLNPKYWNLIYEFYQLTKVPILLNTSFNKHGLPIVHSPKEAIEHLLWGCVDSLVIGDFFVTKR